MEEALSCKFCYNLYTDPVQLHCGHSICFTCAEKCFLLKQSELFNPQTHSLKVKQILFPTGNEDISPEIVKIHCPTCNVETELEVQKGLKHLKKNLDLIEILQARAAGKDCEMECGAKATCECPKCEALLCENCFSEEHSKSPLFKKHPKLPLAKRPSVRECAIHHEKIVGFCTQCNEVICNTCTNFEDGHKGHNKCVTLVQYKQQLNEQLAVAQKQMQEVKPKFEEFDKQTDEQANKLHITYKESVKMINDAFDNLAMVLDRRRLQLLANVNSLKGLMEQELTTQKKINSVLLKDLNSALQEDVNNLDTIDLGLLFQRISAFMKQMNQQKQQMEALTFPQLTVKLDTEGLQKSIASAGTCKSCTAPDKITQIEQVMMPGKQLSIKWNAPHDGGDPIIAYHVSIQQGNQDPRIIRVTLTEFSEPVDAGTYFVSVRAQNEFGLGEMSHTLEAAVKATRLMNIQEQKGLLHHLGVTRFRANEQETQVLMNVGSNIQVTAWAFGHLHSGGFLFAQPDENITLDLGPHTLVPSHLSIRIDSRRRSGEPLVQLTGSLDGFQYFDLPLNRQAQACGGFGGNSFWDKSQLLTVTNLGMEFKYFKITCPRNSCVSELELYGEMFKQNPIHG